MLGVLLLLSPFAAAASPTTAQSAAQARAQGDLRGARALFEQALAEGGNDVSWLRAIYLELGMLRADAGEDAAAETAFSALLSLSPDVTLPPGAAPNATAAFDRARANRGASPPLRVTVTAQDPTEAGRAHRATVHVEGDTARLVASARATILSGPSAGATAEARAADPLVIELPREATRSPGELRYKIEVLDAHGSVLATDGSDAAPRVVQVVAFQLPTAPVETTPEEEQPGSAWSSPWLWGALAVVVVGGLAVGLAYGADAFGSGVGRVGTPEIR